MSVLELVYIDHAGGEVTVRTDLGPFAARRLAAFELEGEVYISRVFETPITRLMRLKEIARARKEKRPPVFPSTRDFVFTRRVGRDVALEDLDDVPSLHQRATGGSFSEIPVRKPKFKLKSLVEFLRDQIAEEA